MQSSTPLSQVSDAVSAVLKSKKSSPSYLLLLQQLRGTSTPDKMLRRLLQAFTRCAGELVGGGGGGGGLASSSGTTGLGLSSGSVHDELITAIFSLRFRPTIHGGDEDNDERMEDDDNSAETADVGRLGRSDTRNSSSGAAAITSLTTARAFFNFSRAFVSASSKFFLLTCRSILRSLSSAQTEADTSCKLLGSSSDGSLILKNSASGAIRTLSSQLTGFNNLAYDALTDIVKSVPTGTGALFTALAEALPHKNRPCVQQEAYSRHLLHLAKRLPSIRDRVIAMMVERLVDYDLDTQLELLPDPNDEEEIKRASLEAAKNDSHSVALQATMRSAEKLDSLLVLLVRFIHFSICGCKGQHQQHHSQQQHHHQQEQLLSKSESILPVKNKGASGLASLSDDDDDEDDDDDA
jgi:hypothetical protein